MGFWSRLGRVIDSYVNDMIDEVSKESPFRSRGYTVKNSGDSDLNDAFDELNDFLNYNDSRSEKKAENSRQEDFNWQNEYTRQNVKPEQTAEVKLPPKELRIDFGCLEVPFGADLETCKAAYKNLLKIHHPDHHAGNEVNFKKATTRTARINAAWERIEMWHKGEYIPE